MAGLFRIRPATRADAAAIAVAEQICFSDPWSQGALAELFENQTVVALVGEREGPNPRLAGYIFARAIAGEAEILNIAVLPEFRRGGLGSDLLSAGLDGLRSQAATSVYLEVRESNDEARRLYGARGFRPVGIRTDYYQKPRENALVLRLDFS